jgi:hypothetical protein
MNNAIQKKMFFEYLSYNILHFLKTEVNRFEHVLTMLPTPVQVALPIDFKDGTLSITF